MAKVTKRDNFVAIADVLADVEGTDNLVEFVEAQIELLDKRKAAGRKPTKAQLANEDLKSDIVSGLQALDGEGSTATEIANAYSVSVQKASQLLRQLVLAGVIERVEGKGKERTKFVACE